MRAEAQAPCANTRMRPCSASHSWRPPAAAGPSGSCAEIVCSSVSADARARMQHRAAGICQLEKVCHEHNFAADGSHERQGDVVQELGRRGRGCESAVVQRHTTGHRQVRQARLEGHVTLHSRPLPAAAGSPSSGNVPHRPLVPAPAKAPVGGQALVGLVGQQRH